MQLNPKTCCGQAHATAFCPDCGRKLLTHPLVELLGYCRMMLARSSELALTRTKAGQRTRPGTVVKWTRWVEALEEATGQKSAPTETAQALKLVKE